MFEIRTDLAVEINELKNIDRSDKSIKIEEEDINGNKVTTVTVSKEGEAKFGKKSGRYITIDIGKAWEKERAEFESTAKTVSKMIKRLMPKPMGENGSVTVAGFGNRSITSDAIGPLTVGKLLVTRHIKESDEALFNQAGFGCLSAVLPGVMAQTGIESSVEVEYITKNIKSDCIIAVDSLASRKLSRLATTIQICDTGISPGSGVYNRRRGLTEETAGIPVIAIGVPTVVEAATLAYDIIREAGGNGEKAAEEIRREKSRCMFVTPKECDIISEKLSRLIADGINMAVHKKLSLDEMMEYTS